MRSSLTTGLAIACVALTAGIVYIGHELSVERERAGSESQAKEIAERKLRELEQRVAAVSRRREFDRAEPSSNSQPVSTRPSAPTGNYSSGFAVTNPEQPSPVDRRRPFAPRMNSDLLLTRTLKLNEADESKLLGILHEEQEKFRKAVSGQPGRTIDQQTLTALQAESDQRVREALGEDKFKEYQDYRRYQAEHEQINVLNNRLTNVTGSQLTAAQEVNLLAALKEERSRVPAPSVSQFATRPEFITAMNAWRDDYTHRTQQRAATILTPEQVPVFQSMRNFGGPPRGGRP